MDSWIDWSSDAVAQWLVAPEAAVGPEAAGPSDGGAGHGGGGGAGGDDDGRRSDAGGDARFPLLPPSTLARLADRRGRRRSGCLRGFAALRRSGGRQRERWRALRQQQAGAAEPQAYDVLGVRARAREELELLTGVSAAEVERRLQAARERCLTRGWDWGGLDDGALA